MRRWNTNICDVCGAARQQGGSLRRARRFFPSCKRTVAKLVRRDFSAEAWTGPSAESLGWWKSVLPRRETQRVHWAPNDVMLDLLEQLAGDPAQADMRYVLALLLVRRRVCRLVETPQEPENRDLLVLYCPRREVEYRVNGVVPDRKRAKEIQDELARLLFAS